MFCPNCGNDCGSAKCCPLCGAHIQKGSFNRPVYEKDSFVVPKRKFTGVGGYIKLEEDVFCICNTKIPFGKEVRILYSELTAVVYSRPKYGLLSKGSLLVRWEGNQSNPIPKCGVCRKDETAIAFSKKQDIVFYHVYCLLKARAPMSILSYMNVKPISATEADLDSLVQASELDEYFNKFNPYRTEAAMALFRSLCRRQSVNTLVVSETVERAFDLRQKELYSKNPDTAIRDLNRIIKHAILNHSI